MLGPFFYSNKGVNMIYGIGTDIVEIDRMKKAIAKEAFVKRVFSEAEIDYCHSRKAGAPASFAGRFAAKEAVLKAFGTGLRDGRLVDIEVINDELGCPHLVLKGYFKEMMEAQGIKRVWISISHAQAYATAQCVMETEGEA